jgi:hypothetical protein
MTDIYQAMDRLEWRTGIGEEIAKSRGDTEVAHHISV